jgi:hypothetical protein
MSPGIVIIMLASRLDDPDRAADDEKDDQSPGVRGAEPPGETLSRKKDRSHDDEHDFGGLNTSSRRADAIGP